MPILVPAPRVGNHPLQRRPFRRPTQLCICAGAAGYQRNRITGAAIALNNRDGFIGDGTGMVDHLAHRKPFAGAKVKRVVNYYLPNGKNVVRRGDGFKGKLANVNVSNIPDITHTTVEKTRKLQNRAIGTVMSLVKKRRRRG